MNQLRQRFLILLMMIAVSVIFISCQDLAIIPEIYVAVHNLRFTTLMTVMYFAGTVACTYISGVLYFNANLCNFLLSTNVVYPELKSKNDKLIEYGFALYCSCGFLFRVLDTYSVYYSNSIQHLIPTILHAVCLVLGFCSVFRWLYIVSLRQNSRYIHFKRLTIDEIVTLFYVLPYLTQSGTFFWNIFSGETHWKDRHEGSLILQMCLVYLFYLMIIRKTHKIFRCLTFMIP